MKFSITKWASIFVLILTVIVTLFPVVWMALSSVKSKEEIFSIPPTWIPKTFTLRHYEDLFTRFNFGRLTINSTIIAVGVTVISVVIGSMAAYGFSRYSFRGSGMLLAFILIARMITPAALVIPLFTMMRAFGLLDTIVSIMIGITIINLPFVIWIMKTFFDGLPKEVEEAAEVDGMSPIRTFWKIVVPTAMPAIATVVLFSFVTAWVDFLFGISFSTTAASMPLTVGISNMQTGYEIYWGPMMAAGVYLTLPTLILAFLLQKYFIKGLTMGY
jgi:ABC-type glycerol-3-phosphate transport system permease component